MGQVPSMMKPMALATYTDMRNMSTCSDMISLEECQTVVLSSKWHNWYWADIMYGQSTIYFYSAGLGLFTVGNLLSLWRERKSKSDSNHQGRIWKTISSITRFALAKQWRLNRRFGYTLTLGQAIIVCAMLLFFSVITLAPKPYYWPNPMDYGYSPPIATRAGFLAIAILPFQVMFAAKWNSITYLTGVSHEKLQVYHRWSGWIMYVLALIHTFPFIIVDIQTGMMIEYWHTDFYTVSGVICLVPQTGLVLLSIGAIRNSYYETFKSLHYLMAACFIVVLFLHCGFTLTSAYYFVGFAATYALSLVVRWGRMISNGFKHRATIEHIDDRMVRVTISTKLSWKPGQHYFFRFLTKDLHSLTSHPLTVASIPNAGGSEKENALELFIKPHKGATGALQRRERADVGVLIDGPYGGLQGEISLYDRILLIGGGSGGSFILGIVRHLTQNADTQHWSSLTVVYVCRKQSDAQWFHKALFVACQSCTKPVQLFFHVSLSAPQATTVDEDQSKEVKGIASDDEQSQSQSLLQNEPLTSTRDGVKSIAGRPDLPSHVQSATRASGTVGIAICGPREMVFDVRNSVADVQMGIVSGEVGCSECYLHTEVFEW